MNRRHFLRAGLTLAAAPMVVRAESIMRVAPVCGRMTLAEWAALPGPLVAGWYIEDEVLPFSSTAAAAAESRAWHREHFDPWRREVGARILTRAFNELTRVQLDTTEASE